jgi:hypothetical protein
VNLGNVDNWKREVGMLPCSIYHVVARGRAIAKMVVGGTRRKDVAIVLIGFGTIGSKSQGVPSAMFSNIWLQRGVTLLLLFASFFCSV